MEDLFLAVFGLPLHPLAVHFAVVLFPLSLLLFLLVLFIPKLRTRFTLWAALLVTSTTPTVVLAQQSGLHSLTLSIFQTHMQCLALSW